MIHRTLLAVAPGLIALIAPGQATSVWANPVQLQLSCTGTVLEARGSATLRRPVDRLAFALALEAVAPSSKEALALLQQRLDAVRTALKRLAVAQLRVGSPSVWNRYRPAGQPESFEASTQVGGQLAPSQLQALISEVGGLPGVRLSPVDPLADPGADAASNRQLLQAAYRDALRRAQDLGAAIGLGSLRPLQVQIEGGVSPLPMAAAMQRRAPAPFDPRELPEPSDRLSLAVTFCATP